MAVIITLLILVGLYVGAGFLVTLVNAKARDDEFTVNWVEILRWPKDVF